MASKRQSLAPSAPKPPTSLSSTCHISDAAIFVGTHLVKISGPTFLHPRCKLNSTYGPITIGFNCIIAERCQIGSPSDSLDAEGVVIENGVVLEVGAVIEAKRVGEGCLIEVNAKIGRGAVLGKHCKIGPLCEVEEDEVLPDFTVIYGFGMRRIDNSGAEEQQAKFIAKQIEVLRKLIPSNIAKFQ